MTAGPFELIVLGFEGNNFKGEIAKAIQEAESTGSVRVVDLVFVIKAPDGAITAMEIEDAQPFAPEFQALERDVKGLLTEDDAMTVAELLPPNTAALAVVIEHTWASKISEAVRNAGGRMLASQRISPDSIDAVSDEIEALIGAR
jgi:uncharacterized membrane protein